MGKVKRVLASKKLKALQENFCGIELCETVHLHMPDFRFELTTEQFKVFAETVHKALEKWISLGKPDTFPQSSDGFIFLAGEHLPGEPVYTDRFEVEEQTIPVVHVHLRGLSIRPSIPEFMEFAEVIWEAKQNLTK